MSEMNDFMVMQSAAIDASMRRLTMQSAAMRNQNNARYAQSQAPQYVITVETSPIPLAHDSCVIGTVYLLHKTNDTSCSLRCGREVRTLKFRTDTERSQYIEELCQQHDHKRGMHTCGPCPECFPKILEDKHAKSLYPYIKEGALNARDIGLDFGYYMRRENATFVMKRFFNQPTVVRFFHKAGRNCGMRRGTTLIGPYGSAGDLFRKYNIPGVVDGVNHLPCPTCYTEEEFAAMDISSTLYKAFLVEQKLDML